ncbi:hypothetical protein SmJEL517_g03019 [Synchytrium microbalum]|uniref:Uncharacterized protein n=1 Tax=Synchytrium microbalum TaxID=1806994 RepID=A0A507C4J7_9FUNG|nr:uncharacterized protein SmJEL517_g03019 [Synchytrium microbalum]TPX34318.1 hypothetical protein SmJEL517_g03019 [Synchytrium microbalum]
MHSILYLILFPITNFALAQDEQQEVYDTCNCYCCPSSCTSGTMPPKAGNYSIVNNDITLCSAGLCNVHFPNECPNILQNRMAIVRTNMTCESCVVNNSRGHDSSSTGTGSSPSSTTTNSAKSEGLKLHVYWATGGLGLVVLSWLI